jgi:hypothetical protein
VNVLVACECSGRVKTAFRNRGHNAWSCDLKPSEIPDDKFHIRGDVKHILGGLPLCPICQQVMKSETNCWICDDCQQLFPLGYVLGQPVKQWDLVIAHPDCRLFANAGLHYLKTQPDRQQEQSIAFEFIKQLWDAPIEKVVIENPIGWLNTHWRKPSQIIQPYYFGEAELKTTCLWLKNVPPLMATLICEIPKPKGYCVRQTGNKAGDKYNYYFRQGKNAADRARTFQGIANAMAEQWG